MRPDYGLLLWPDVVPQGVEREVESLAAERLLHRWGVEPGALRLSGRSTAREERPR